MKSKDKEIAQGEGKLLVNFKKITKTENFQQEVKRIREILNLPVEGVMLQKGESSEVIKQIKTPEREESTYILNDRFIFETVSKYPKEIKKLESMFPVMNNYFSMLLRNYIYYNIFLYDELMNYDNPIHNICDLVDAEQEYSEFMLDEDPESNFSIDSHNNAVIRFIDNKPISIRLHAEASQRDVVDFVEKNWKKIEELQGKYTTGKIVFGLKHSKTRKNNKIEERDDLIYMNQDKSSRELISLVKQKTNMTLDLGHIDRIKQVERKKRKKV